MLNDLFMIELYFGTPESAQAQEEMIRRYGYEAFRSAVDKGYLHQREMFMGPLRGKILCWLSENGRRQAGLSVVPPQ